MELNGSHLIVSVITALSLYHVFAGAHIEMPYPLARSRVKTTAMTISSRSTNRVKKPHGEITH